MRFKDKVILITGAAKGIGRATALKFAKEGAIVVVNYLHSEQEAKETLVQIKTFSDGIIIQADVSDEKQVAIMFDKIHSVYGKLDILVNNAGKYFDGDEWDGPVEIWEETLKINLISMMLCSKYATKMFQSQQNWNIVNIASRYSLSWQFDSFAYAASKAAIVNITQAYAELLSPYGRANAISPGATEAGYRLHADKEELDWVISRSPHKRLISPDEIADTILFLSSTESAMITGQNILVDGGK